MIASAAFAVASALAAARPPAPEGRLEAVRAEIARLKRESEALAGRERGLLGDLARMDAAIALRAAELEASTLQLASTETALGAHERELSRLTAAQAERAPRVAARLRALYARGPATRLGTLLLTVPVDGRREGIGYASYLARRDASQVAAWRETTGRLRDEAAALSRTRGRLETARASADASRAALESARNDREVAVAHIRDDRAQHDAAIRELEAAAEDLSRVLAAPHAGEPVAGLDVRAFRGLLDWPADGPVSAGFGVTVHPRFKTAVPHPGVDIDAPAGAPFRSVFDGRVVYAETLHGYGLTVVVDHGNGIASVYAHASLVLVGAGDEVVRGQELGRVGESGSLRGPYLYLELRDAGKPVDPASWLRRR